VGLLYLKRKKFDEVGREVLFFQGFAVMLALAVARFTQGEISAIDFWRRVWPEEFSTAPSSPS
jgi:hypothetical protein